MERGEAIALIERLHEALGAYYTGSDARPVRVLLTDDIEWHVPGSSAIAGDYHGIEEVFGYFAKRRDFAKGTLRMHPKD